MPSVKERAKDINLQKLAICIAGAALVISALSTAWGIRKDIRSGRAADERMGAIETSLRILTQTVAPQIYASISDSLRSAISADTNVTLGVLKGTQTSLAQLEAAKARPDREQLADAESYLARIADYTLIPTSLEYIGQANQLLFVWGSPRAGSR